jgi:Ran GTPase-activating protein (RanGAP) involved in mRNA processing and transport
MDWSSPLLADILRHHLFGPLDDAWTLICCRLVCRLWNVSIVVPKIRYHVKHIVSTSSESMSRLTSFLSNKTRSLSLSGADFSDLDSHIFSKMHFDTTITRLTFCNMHLAGAKNFISFLRSNKTLRSLNFNASDLWNDEEDYISELATSLGENSSLLNQVSIESSRFSDKSAFKFAESISTNTTLKTLSLHQFNFDRKGLDTLVTNLLQTKANITKLVLRNISTLSILPDCLGTLIRETTRLKSLTLYPLYDSGLVPIFENLEKNKSIEHLDVSGADLDYVGPAMIGQYLQLNGSLTSLNLSSCQPYYPSILYGLSRNTTLRSLDLSMSAEGDEGYKMLNEVLLAGNQTLNMISLANHAITSDGAIEIAQAIRQSQNTSLQYLDLRFNRIDDKGAVELAKLCESCPWIKSINLKENSTIQSYDQIHDIDQNHRIGLSYMTSDNEDTWDPIDKDL